MAESHNEVDMDKLLLNYDLENREIFYDRAYKTEELEKSYVTLGDLKKENFVLQTTLETLKITNADLETKLKHTSKRLATLNVNPPRGKALIDGSNKIDLLILENKTLKEMLFKLQKEKDDIDQINARNDAKYKCTLLNNQDLIKERNTLRENVELLTKAVAIKKKETSDLILVKENIVKLDGKIKESTFYISEINKLKKLNVKQQEDITYYRAYADQLKDMISDLQQTKSIYFTPKELGSVKEHYEHCAEKIESLKTDLADKLKNERKSNELLIRIDNLMRNKYNIARNELECLSNKNKDVENALLEVNNKYKIATNALEDMDNKYRNVKNDEENKYGKALVDAETQTEIIKQEKFDIMDLTTD